MILSIVGWKTHTETNTAGFPQLIKDGLFFIEKGCQVVSALIMSSAIIVFFFDLKENASFSKLCKWIRRVKQLIAIKYEYRYVHSPNSPDSNWKEELKLITELGRMAYGNSIKKAERFRAYLEWFLANKLCFMVLTANGYPIGFICCLPMGNR